MKTKHAELKMTIFKWFWLIAIMPKSVQFLVLFIITSALICITPQHGRITRGNSFLLFFIGGVVVQILAIVLQLVINNADISRTLAAFNTALIWILGIFLYNYYSRISFNMEEIKRVKKYILFNFAVLFALYIFSLFFRSNTVSMMGYSLPLRHDDYLNGVHRYRFSGLLETQLATSHMFLIFMPLILLTVKKKRNDLFGLIVVSLAYVAVLAGYSRSGVVVCTVSYIAYVWSSSLAKKLSKNSRKIIVGIAIILGIFIGMVSYKEISRYILNLFNSRSASNSARFFIYSESLKKVLSENPLFGIGIKYMIPFSWYDIPYGSHSTYIGILYKSGILGTILFGCGFIKLIKRISLSLKRFGNYYAIMISILAYFVFLLVADIDGINWVMTLVFSVWGLLSNQVFVSASQID